MEKYSINKEIKGYKNIDTCDKQLENSIIVIVLRGDTDENIGEYCRIVRDGILNNNKVIAIIVGNDISKYRPVVYLMASYRNYNIYNVENEENIDKDYINNVESREASYEEAQTFIGGDVTAYAEMDIIINGVYNLIMESNYEGLKVFLEKHIDSIAKFEEIAYYIKEVIGEYISNSYEETIAELREKIRENEVYIQEATDVKYRYEEAMRKIDKQKKEISELKKKAEESKSNASSGITEYSEINTALIKNKAKIVVYFKEISRVQYINTLVINLMQLLQLRDKRVKLLVYENKNGMNAVYNGINILGSSEYMKNREGFMGASPDKLVIVEPNPAILEDVLGYSKEAYDVVIVYDRMKQEKDIVVGNNVYKFYVVNSKSDYENTKAILKIKDGANIITKVGSSITSDTDIIDIQTIKDYNSKTTSAKLSTYMKLETTNGKPVIKTIYSRARIDSIL